MEFSVRSLHELEDKILNFSEDMSATLKCSKLETMTKDMLSNRSVTKEFLVEAILNMRDLISGSRNVLRSAMESIDHQNSELMKNKNEIIEMQTRLISCKNDNLVAVQETVKSEVLSFSDVVKKNCTGSNITTAKLKQVVKSAIKEDERPKNFMIFGADEEISCNGKKLDDRDLLDDIFSVMTGIPEPIVTRCQRMGQKKTDGTGRPIKVTLQSPEMVYQVLKNSKAIKPTLIPGYSFIFNKLYLSPDRSPEERKVRKDLVLQMKEKIKEDPSKRYYIKDNKVNIVSEA